MPASSTSDFAPADPKSTGVASTATPLTKGGDGNPLTNLLKGGKKSRRKSRKMNGAAKSWVNFVVDVFNKGRAKNPSYKYKQAMKDASKMKKKNKTMKM